MDKEVLANNALASFSLSSEIFKIASMEGGAEALEAYTKLFPVTTGSALAEGAPTKIEKQEERVLNRVLTEYNFVKILELRDRGLYYKSDEDTLYRYLDDSTKNELINKYYQFFYHRMPSSDKIKKFGETLPLWVDNKRERINNDIIMIKDDLFWDYKRQKLVDTPPEDNECFRRLFDHKETDEIKINPNKLDENTIRIVFSEVYEHLKRNEGRINIHKIKKDCPILSVDLQPLNAFWLWANEDDDTLNDILMALSCNFMRVKPKGAFILIGRTRNGKSSFILLLHTQFGHNNTAEVALADLNDPHLNMELLGALINAPDEEEEGRGADILKAQGRFKKLATHKALALQVYYSQNPQPVATDFMSYHAMNDVPQWQGTGAEACMKRSLIIMFEHDFSGEDNSGKEFEKETYTPEFFSVLLGIEFAYAKYYDGKEFKFSDKQKARKQLVAEEVDNMSVYLDSFLSFYPGGYANVSLVYEDYKLWCTAKGLRWASFQDFNKKLKARGGYPSKITTEKGENIHVVKLDKNGAIFHRDARIEAFGGQTVEYMITSEEGTFVKHPHRAQSVIEQLEIRYESDKKKYLFEEEEKNDEEDEGEEDIWT